MLTRSRNTQHPRASRVFRLTSEARTVSTLSFAFLLIAASCMLAIQIKPATGRLIFVPNDIGQIQSAVNSASSGDTIQVMPGTYDEHVVIPSTLKSLTIVGNITNPASTIVDGMGNGTVFRIDGDHITIKGFTIRNAGNNHNAISIEMTAPAKTDANVITNNTITTSNTGIKLSITDGNTISYNIFTDDYVQAIYISDSDSNTVQNNNITDSAYGVRIENSLTNTVKNNIITGTTYGIRSEGSTQGTVDHNTLYSNAYAIYFVTATRATITYNNLTNNSWGLRLYHTAPTSAYFEVYNNRFYDNDYAIEGVYSNLNTFTGNWIQKNTWGVLMSYGQSNVFYHNSFKDNTQQAVAPQTNTWYSTSLNQGNYWSDYTGQDILPPTGIGDSPYTVTGSNLDNYPLIYTWSEHDISVESVTTSTNQVYVGQSLNVYVTVKNKANITASETFTVTARYNSSIIGTQQVSSLPRGTPYYLTFTWQTTGLTPANYTISAQTSVVANELNTDNNKRTDGTVKIRIHITGDINGDAVVNTQDLIILESVYGTTSQSPSYNPAADLNNDGVINTEDLRLLGKDYGKTS